MVLANSTELQDSLGAALAELAHGTAPAEVLDFLRHGRVFPLPKGTDGIRPLTVANVMRRSSLKEFIKQNKARCKEAVGPTQHGVAR